MRGSSGSPQSYPPQPQSASTSPAAAPPPSPTRATEAPAQAAPAAAAAPAAPPPPTRVVHAPPQPRRLPSPSPAPQGHPLPPSDHPVLELIKQRLLDGSSPGARSDGFKLGLAVEGGGMRGIVTGAMLMSLLGFDALPAFDAIYGASAGAINATYFLTGQPEGLDIYTDHLAASDRFLSLRRYFSGRGAAMDLEYLLDEVMVSVTPLDWHGVMASPVPLKVVASSLDSLRAELLQDFTCPADLRECLKASARVPEIAGPPQEHRGHRFVDAAVFEPIPVKSAVRDGCTHVLALCSRPASSGPAWSATKVVKQTLTATVKRWVLNPPYMREAWAAEHRHVTHQGVPMEDLLVGMVAGPGSGSTLDLSDEDSPAAPAAPSLAAAAAAQAREAASDMAGCGSAAGVRAADGVGGSHILPLYPTSAAAFSPVCKDIPTLQRGRQEGFDAVQRVMLPVLEPRPWGR